jgi:hypothetical protein
MVDKMHDLISETVKIPVIGIDKTNQGIKLLIIDIDHLARIGLFFKQVYDIFHCCVMLRKESDGYFLDLANESIPPIPITKTYTDAILSLFTDESPLLEPMED